MTAQKLQAAREEIKKEMASEISKAFNILYTKWLSKPCSFKDKDLQKAAFSAIWNGDLAAAPLEKKYGLRLIILTVAAGARQQLMSAIKAAKLTNQKT